MSLSDWPSSPPGTNFSTSVRHSGHEVHMPLPSVSTRQKVWNVCLHAVVVTSDAGPRISRQMAHSSACRAGKHASGTGRARRPASQPKCRASMLPFPACIPQPNAAEKRRAGRSTHACFAVRAHPAQEEATPRDEGDRAQRTRCLGKGSGTRPWMTRGIPVKSLLRRACMSRSYLDFCMFLTWSLRSLYRTSPLL